MKHRPEGENTEGTPKPFRLPPGWTSAALGEVVARGVQQAAPEQPMPYVDIGSLDRERKQIGETAIVNAATAPTRARQRIIEGDVLVSLTRPNLNAVAMVPSSLDGAVASTGFDVLRPAGILPAWLLARVRSTEFVTDVCQGLQGVVYPAIRPRDVRHHRLPLPPLQEQHRIAAVLDSYLSRLDETEAALERVERNLKRYRAAVLQAAVTGKLVPTEAELARADGRDYEPASDLLQRVVAERRRRWEEEELARIDASAKRPHEHWRARYQEPISPSTEGLPALPQGWCWGTIDQIAWVKGGITKNQARRSAQPLRPVPYLRVANVQRGYLDLGHIETILATAAEIDELRLLPGDVLFNEGGDRDKLGRGWVWRGEIGDCIHQNHVFRARPIEGVRSEYLSWYGNSEGQRYFFEQGKQTTNLASINLTKLRSLPVALPPLAEQSRILAEADRLLSVADEAAAEVKTQRTRIARLRQSILKWAFEGKLVDQDPNDEPASVLLERIRAARAGAGDEKPPKRQRRARKES